MIKNSRKNGVLKNDALDLLSKKATMSMSDNQAQKLLLRLVTVLGNIKKKQCDRISETLDFKLQDDMCLNMLLHAVELYTWNDYYELQAKREAEWQAHLSQKKAIQRDQERSQHLYRQEEYHA